MCGRFTMRSSGKEVAEVFGLTDEPTFLPRFNIAPTQTIPVVQHAATGRRLAFLRWGLIPHWADDPKIGYKMINARAETAATKPSFRGPFKHQRCLVIADGFYEWQKSAGKKQPYYMRMRDSKPFAFAALWDHWEKGYEPIDSCTILTTEANEVMKTLHDRMPVILDPTDFGAWLNPELASHHLQALLRPYRNEKLIAIPVGALVNNARNDDSKCMEPLSGFAE